MLAGIRVSAPAKINIGLKVFPKRADGFHDIESIFQTVCLCDELEVTLTAENRREFTVSCDAMELPEDNTLSRTYEAFCDLTGKSIGVRVMLKKHIPAGGGLGGGSSDATAFLRALCTITEETLSAEQQAEIAARVGSDVFFFLHCRYPGCAVVSGRGEKVRTISPRSDIYVLLVFPGVHSSTKVAYGLVDAYMESGKLVDGLGLPELEAEYRKPAAEWRFTNSFTAPLAQTHPEIGRALSDVRSAGALFADMSGSGSTVYGVFDSVSAVKNASLVLTQSWNCCAAVPDENKNVSLY